MRKLLTVIVIFLFFGCSSPIRESVNTVIESYGKIDYNDGLSLDEAKIVAQNELISKGLVAVYDIINPQEARDLTFLPHFQDYWFIYFKESDRSRIEFIFMVAINKQNGNIKFSDDFADGNWWILEAALLRKTNKRILK